VVTQQTTTIPIVFVQVTDPVSSGFVESLARPGGNITGFSSFDFSLSTKWLEILKDIAPAQCGISTRTTAALGQLHVLTRRSIAVCFAPVSGSGSRSQRFRVVP
jgi:ABC transporter substrate binding protein